MKRFRFTKFLPCFLVLGMFSGNVFADGGIIRLRQTQGPFIVTIFTPSEVVQDGIADMGVMVQKRDSSDAVLDATVDLILTPPAGLAGVPMESMCGIAKGSVPGADAAVVTIQATREQASDKLLYAAAVHFGVAGNWRLEAIVKRGSEAVEAACDVPVGSPPPRLAGLLPYLATPPLLVGLFAMNQFLRKQSLGKRP